MSASGLDGYELNEIGVKNANINVDDRQSGNHWSFENITLSVRRPSGGGIAISVGEENATRPWMFRAAVGPQVNGVRSVEIAADKVLVKDLLFGLRLKDASYTADLPISGRLRGEIGRDGLPTYFTGKIGVDAGSIIDRRAPEYPMNIDRADISVDWDSTRRVLVAPFQVVAGTNRITLLAHLEPPTDTVPHWQLGLSGGTIVLPGTDGEAPLIFNRIAVRMRFDIDGQRIVLTQGDISNGTVGVAGTGTFDYSTAEPRLTAGIAGTPMSASELKRMWPVVINPEVREWVLARVDGGMLQRAEIAINAPTHTLARGGPPIPEEGLSINFVASNVKMRPVDELPPVSDAGMRVRITGRTANINIAQASMDTAGGRKLGISDFAFDIADLAPKPMQTKVRFRVDAPLPAVAEILSSDRWSEFSGVPIDPVTSRGNATAVVTLAMPLKKELTKHDTAYTVNADLNNISVDKLVINQRLDGNNLKLVANNQGFQIRGEIKINGQTAALDYRKPMGDVDADVRVTATLDDASRARLGIDLGPAATGNIPLKLNGKIGSGDRDSRFGVEADLSNLRIDNLLPGWIKTPGRSSKATFNVVRKEQSTRFEDVVIEGGGASIKGSLEVDDKGDLVAAFFPTYHPSEGDRASLRAERAQDGLLKVTMRGDVFDGRSFIKASVGGSGQDKNKQKIGDFELDLKFGAVAGHNGEAMRSVDLKLARRGGVIRTFALSGKIGRDTPGRGRYERTPAGTYRDVTGGGRRRRPVPLHGYVHEDVRRPRLGPHGSADRGFDAAGRPAQRARIHDPRSAGTAANGAEPGQRAERRSGVLAHARGVHPLDRCAVGSRGHRRRSHHGRHRRGPDRLRHEPGAGERHLPAGLRAEQHLRPDSGRRAVSRRRQQRRPDRHHLRGDRNAEFADTARQSALGGRARRAAKDLRIPHRPPAADAARQLHRPQN